MNATASEIWLAELSETAELDDEFAHAVIRIDLDIDSELTLRRRHTNPDRVQGLALDTDGGFIIDDQEMSRIVLWSDTAPDDVTISARAGRLTVWNVWRDGGTAHAWIGDARIRRAEIDAEHHDAAARLSAVDGHPGDGTDLVIDLFIDGS